MAVVVFGSINLDLMTRVETLPRPGETVLGERLNVAPGGKGANQALAARRSGRGDVRLVGCVGTDGFADQALALLIAEGVDLSRVVRMPGPTGVAMIAVSRDGANQIVAASGANRLVKASSVTDDW